MENLLSPQHIQLTVGNVFAIGFLSIIFNGAAAWLSAWAASSNIPGISHMGVGAQYFLHAA